MCAGPLILSGGIPKDQGMFKVRYLRVGHAWAKTPQLPVLCLASNIRVEQAVPGILRRYSSLYRSQGRDKIKPEVVEIFGRYFFIYSWRD